MIKSTLLRLLLAFVLLCIPSQSFAFGGGSWAGWARRGWIPRDLGPVAIFRGEDYNATTGVWTDRSGNNNHATAVGTKPTAGTAINGRATVHWTATSGQQLVTPSMAIGPFTAVVDGKVTTTAGYLLVQINDAGADYAYMYGGLSIAISRGSVVSEKNRASNWFADNVEKCAAWRFNGTHASHLLDIGGVSQSLTNVTSNDPGTGTATGTWSIGGRANGGGIITGDISYVVLFGRSLNATELARVFFYTLGYYGN